MRVVRPLNLVRVVPWARSASELATRALWVVTKGCVGAGDPMSGHLYLGGVLCPGLPGSDLLQLPGDLRTQLTWRYLRGGLRGAESSPCTLRRTCKRPYLPPHPWISAGDPANPLVVLGNQTHGVFFGNLEPSQSHGEVLGATPGDAPFFVWWDLGLMAKLGEMPPLGRALPALLEESCLSCGTRGRWRHAGSHTSLWSLHKTMDFSSLKVSVFEIFQENLGSPGCWSCGGASPQVTLSPLDSVQMFKPRPAQLLLVWSSPSSSYGWSSRVSWSHSVTCKVLGATTTETPGFGCCWPWRCLKDLWSWRWGTWFSGGLGTVGLLVGLDDLQGLCQWFWDSLLFLAWPLSIRVWWKLVTLPSSSQLCHERSSERTWDPAGRRKALVDVRCAHPFPCYFLWEVDSKQEFQSCVIES